MVRENESQITKTGTLPITVNKDVVKHLSLGLYRNFALSIKELISNAYDAGDIRKFIGGLRSGSNRIYVSTGGFAKDVKYEAERSNIPLTLIDPDLLVDLIIEYYDHFDPDTRSPLPLTKIYWPS